MNVYVASSLDNKDKAARFISRLRELGHNITYDWTTHGRLTDKQQMRIAAHRELHGVLGADVLVVYMPGGFGTHCEMGIALGAGKRVILVRNGYDLTCSFHTIVDVVENEEELIAKLDLIDGHTEA